MVSPTAKPGRNMSPENDEGSAYPAASLTRLGLYDSSGSVHGDAFLTHNKRISFFLPSDTHDVVPIDLKLHRIHTKQPRSRSRSRSATPLATHGPGIQTRSRSRSRSRSASPPRLGFKSQTNLSKTEPRVTRGSRSRSTSPSGAVVLEGLEVGLETAERKTHKCRGRTKSIAWFEVRSLTRWAKPPSAANELSELEDGDMLINWLDFTTLQCQIWCFTHKDPRAAGQWHALRWGAKCDKQDLHRLVITEKGLPSFVAESTWKKKYKPQSPKIVN